MLIARTFFIALTLVLLSGTTTGAQEPGSASGFAPTARFPAQIHAGTCQDRGEVLFSLGEGGFGLPVPDDPAATPGVTAEQVGPGEANPAIVLVSRVNAPLDQLTADSHAIDVHVAGEDPDGRGFVCGVVGGFRAGDDLVFGMQAIDESGYSGAGWIKNLGDGASQVTLFLASPPRTADEISAWTENILVQPDDAAQEAGSVAETVAIDRDAEPTDLIAADTAQVEGLVIRDGEIVTDELTLDEDIPTIVHVVNTDNRDYRFFVDRLVPVTPLPANTAIVLEFDVPTGGIHGARLLEAGSAAELSMAPITVVPR